MFGPYGSLQKYTYYDILLIRVAKPSCKLEREAPVGNTLDGNAASCPECKLSLISAQEAARIMGLSYARVRAILASRPERLQAFRIGKTWVIPEFAAKEYRPLPAHRPRGVRNVSNAAP